MHFQRGAVDNMKCVLYLECGCSHVTAAVSVVMAGHVMRHGNVT